MKIHLELNIDLGDEGTEAEHLADADALVLAVLEATAWRGELTMLRGSDYRGRNWAVSYAPRRSDRIVIEHNGRPVEFAGVEWGGR